MPRAARRWRGCRARSGRRHPAGPLARTGAATTHSTGTAGGNAAVLPIGDARNHCGGAELGSNLGGKGVILVPPPAPGDAGGSG
ncbi:hypothetical protein ACH4OW_26730 [Streptomyces sp. NPDC017056]|uniref:hypothetical protein n=1 Tax=Streptomyces sp. NPDC017056 TaxID=3364973 RepID=UPI003795679E